MVNPSQFLITDRDPGFVLVGVQRRPDHQPLPGSGVVDQVNDYFIAGQGTSAPVRGDETEQAVLDLVPLAGARREASDMQRQLQFVGRFL